jgi:hypothetical protein
MPINSEPVISQWYRHLDKGYEFQVTAIDTDSETVEIQHFDGDLDEVELRDWYSLEIETIETPEDWTGPVDGVEEDDLGYTDTGMKPKDWSEPLEEKNGRSERRSEIPDENQKEEE